MLAAGNQTTPSTARLERLLVATEYSLNYVTTELYFFYQMALASTHSNKVSVFESPPSAHLGAVWIKNLTEKYYWMVLLETYCAASNIPV